MATLYVNGESVAEERVETAQPNIFSADETLPREPASGRRRDLPVGSTRSRSKIWDKGYLDVSAVKKPEMLEFEYARSAFKNGLKSVSPADCVAVFDTPVQRQQLGTRRLTGHTP